MTSLLNQTRTHGTWSPVGAKGDDRFMVTMPGGEAFDTCTLTITGQRLVAGVSVAAQPKPGTTGAGEVVVHWWHEGGSEISYRIEAFSAKRVQGTRTVLVPGFLPSRSFQFGNQFRDRPDLFLNTPFGRLALGSASNGLCGGLAFAARDYFEAKQPIPAGATPPDSGPLFDFFVRRLFDSFDLPGGVMKYMELMHPGLPDHETDLSRIGLAPHGRSWRMVVEEWPQIKADLDAGRLCPLGLVLVKSADPTRLGANHQVLAYGYDLAGDDLSLRIYDPNAPLDDTVRVKLSLARPDASKTVTCGGTQIHSFFRSKYTFAAPPNFQGSAKVKATFTAVANGKLVCAEEGGAKPLTANRAKAGPWETFELWVVGSNRIALKSVANDKFVSAEGGGARPLVANQGEIGPWQTFEICYVDGGHVALKSVANQRFVCAEDGGAKPLVANRTNIGLWETFTLATTA
jgi:hypothetical protein